MSDLISKYRTFLTLKYQKLEYKFMFQKKFEKENCLIGHKKIFFQDVIKLINFEYITYVYRKYMSQEMWMLMNFYRLNKW